MLKTALHYSHSLLKEVVEPGDIVVDATVGNGHDTLLLAQLVGDNGLVYGFDLQQQAILTTQNKLDEAGLTSRVLLYQQGHETLQQILNNETMIKAAVFNLGYLPMSDKTIITKAETTIQALQALLPCLLPNGRIIVVSYYGHDGGSQEKEALLTFVKELPQANFNVLSYQFINQKNTPPILFAIECKKKVDSK